MKAVKLIKDIVIPVNGMPSVAQFDHVIFEGSQGLLLDQEFGFFPHVTRSHTSSKNAMELIRKNSLHMHGHRPDVYYITRSYQTRHGNGPMSNEDKPVSLVNNEDETNVSVKWQGDFRTGILDVDLLRYAIDCDSIYAGACNKSLVVTCLDQTGETFNGTIGGKIVTLDPDKLVDFLSPEPFKSLITSRSPHTEQVIKRQYSL
jgi:adenylosuccinate synthase